MGSRLTGSDRDCSRLMGPSGSWASDRRATMVEPGETEAGSVGTQPMLRDSPLAHRDDKRKRDGFVFTLLNNPHRIGRPRCLENPRPKGRMLTSGDRPFSTSEHSTLRAGIFKASGSTDPMWVVQERENETVALPFIVSMSQRTIPQHGLRPHRARFRFARLDHCSSTI